MTAKYLLTKLYKNHKDISVTESSLDMFQVGLSRDLEHLVQYKGHECKVACKPRVQGYNHYIPIPYYPLPSQRISLPSF